MLDYLAEFLEEHRKILETRLQPITREITDYRARTRDELESNHDLFPSTTDDMLCVS